VRKKLGSELIQTVRGLGYLVPVVLARGDKAK
jgi:DNA-binding response OmpR family regulator